MENALQYQRTHDEEDQSEMSKEIKPIQVNV